MNDFYNLTTRAHPGPHAGRSSVLGAPPAGLNEHARMARWPGPGLLSPLGSPHGARNGVEDEPEFPDEVDGRSAELPSLLARSASGLEFIYKTLDLIAARYRLRDLVVVVTRPDKPHIFRLEPCAPGASNRAATRLTLASPSAGAKGSTPTLPSSVRWRRPASPAWSNWRCGWTSWCTTPATMH